MKSKNRFDYISSYVTPSPAVQTPSNYASFGTFNSNLYQFYHPPPAQFNHNVPPPIQNIQPPHHMNGHPSSFTYDPNLAYSNPSYGQHPSNFQYHQPTFRSIQYASTEPLIRPVKLENKYNRKVKREKKRKKRFEDV